MKQKTLIFPVLFIFLLILSSCNLPNKMSDVNEYIEETDFPYYFLSISSEMRIAKSDKGYYILNGNYIYFMEEDDENPVILDNRPNHECLETKNGGNCDAYVHINQNESILFQFYDDHLYFIEQIKEEKEFDPTVLDTYTYQLVQMSPDGSERKVIRTFEESTISNAAIHRGDLFYIGVKLDKDHKKTSHVSRVPLHKGKKEPQMIISGRSLGDGGYSELMPYGTQLYFLESEDLFTHEYMRYDLIDKELTELSEPPVDIAAPNIASTLHTLNQDKLYFSYYDTDYMGYIDEPIKEGNPEINPLSLSFYSSDLDGSNVKETNIPSVEVMSTLFIDQRYTYTRANPIAVATIQDKGFSEIRDEIKIYNNESELAHTVDTSDFSLTQEFFPGDERYMFMLDDDWDRDEDDSYVVYKFYYLDKDEIETGKAKFKQLLENKTGNGDGIFDLNE